MNIKRFFRKFKILANAFIGYCYKFKIDIFGIGKIKPLSSGDETIIVSLTSYGRRVHSVVYYTLVFLLKQTMMPNKIILWLDDSLTYETLPAKLRNLCQCGIEIRYCNDIRSYKKLIPTLLENSSAFIITVDDDVIYNKHLIHDLWKGYISDHNIQCTVGSTPIITSTGFAPYAEWKSSQKPVSERLIMPIGVGGVLYPPNSLDDEVTNQKAFMELAPNADDLWFWVMAKRKGSSHSIVKSKGTRYSFDAIYQYLHRGSALTHSNFGKSMNDIQLNNIIKHYRINL